MRAAVSQVQQARTIQSEQRAYQHWRETYVLSKALTAAEHTYQSNLLRSCMLAIRRQSELRHKFRMIMKIKHVTLAVKALESMKMLVKMNATARDMKLRATLQRE